MHTQGPANPSSLLKPLNDCAGVSAKLKPMQVCATAACACVSVLAGVCVCVCVCGCHNLS